MAGSISTSPDQNRNLLSLDSEIHRIRRDFPILEKIINGSPLVYLDNAATSQKPLAVIETLNQFYLTSNSNINRGVHTLGEQATELYEQSRRRAQRFVNAERSDEIIFVRGVTEAVNLVAASLGRKRVGSGDRILISEMEHHSNIVPWQMLCEEKSASLDIAPIDADGNLLIDQFEKLLTERTRIVAITHVSNVLGTINPVRHIVDMAHRCDIPVFIDGAQAAPHLPVDVRELGCDFYAFSGHKLYGPTGVGALYGRAELLEEMLPYQTGGGSISSVTFAKTTYKPPPAKFEAGTPNMAGATGLAAAIAYIDALGLERIAAYERELLEYAVMKLSATPRVRIVGNPRERASIVSFVIEGAHAHDAASILDNYGIAIRAGHHCAQPLHERLGLAATARVSLAFYNLKEEIDKLVEGIAEVVNVFGR
ncbi:MAG TPA: cysteine desulfurase [Blastocatellia bacterium]